MGISTLDQFNGKVMDGLDFCKLVYSHFETVRQGPNGVVKLRERQRAEKRLLEELFPICKYIQTNYGPGLYMSICWVDGGPYDAKVKTTGAQVDNHAWPSSGTLEVTQAVHKNEHLMRERLTAEGGGFGLDGLSRVNGPNGMKRVESVPVSFHNQSYIDDFVLIMLDTIKAKIAKTYPEDTTLIIDCSLNTVYCRHEWDELIRRVQVLLPAHAFVQIFACSSAWGFTAVL